MGPHIVVWGLIKLYGLISMVILDLSNLVLRSLSFGNSKFAKPAAKFVAQFHDNFEQNKL